MLLAQQSSAEWNATVKFATTEWFSISHDVTTQVTRKSSLLPWKVSIWIMVKTCVLYASHKIHLLLKFIKIDETSVNLLHNYSKSKCHKLQIFQEFQEFQLYICFNPCYRNLPRHVCSCACICWLFQFACSVYCFLYK